jgi:hypothetical protein
MLARATAMTLSPEGHFHVPRSGFVVAFAFLVVIAEGDLLLPLSVVIPFPAILPASQSKFVYT